MSKEGIVNIRGKEYKTVALRVQEFRTDFPGHSLVTDIVKIDDDQCIVKAMIVKDGTIIATGHAQEFRKASQINGTSYVENCETSAIGVLWLLLVLVVLSLLQLMKWSMLFTNKLIRLKKKLLKLN